MTAQKPKTWVLLISSALLCIACGDKLIRGASPIVRMNELSHQSQVINLQLSIRNLNGVPLDVQNINVSLSAKDELLFSYNGPAQTNIVANGTEVWAMQDEEREAGRVLLDKLQSGDINSLPYTLKGSVTSVEDGTLNFEHTGHIYNVPGRSGHFR